MTLELCPSLGLAVLKALVHGIHDVLEFVNFAVVLCTDECSLCLKLIHECRLFFTEFHPQLLNALPLQV